MAKKKLTFRGTLEAFLNLPETRISFSDRDNPYVYINFACPATMSDLLDLPWNHYTEGEAKITVEFKNKRSVLTPEIDPFTGEVIREEMEKRIKAELESQSENPCGDESCPTCY